MAKITSNWPYYKKIELAGTGSDETGYIVPLTLHRGNTRGVPISSDVFLGTHSKTDFSDIRFTDASGNKLEYYIASSGNYETIFDSSIGGKNYIHSSGAVVASKKGALGLRVSLNNGQTWKTLYGTADYDFYVDAAGTLFFCNAGAYKLYRCTDWLTAATPAYTEILDMSATSGFIQQYAYTEDSDGNLYFGRYQAGYNPCIYKSADDGLNWTQVFGFAQTEAAQRGTEYTLGRIVRPATANSHLYICTTAGTTGAGEPTWPTTAKGTVTDGGAVWTESNLQHVHGIEVDKATGYIYAGIDGSPSSLIRSIDGGATWYVLKRQACDATDIYIGSGYRLFGTGAEGPDLGNAILKTTDDSTFTRSLIQGQSIQSIRKLGSALYAFGVSYAKAAYARIFRSTDDGANWTAVYVAPFDSARNFNGWQYVCESGIPTGETEQQLLAGFLDGALSYTPIRIYEGGTHYQAQVYVKIPTLPAAGDTICVYYGNSSATSESTDAIFADVYQSSIKFRWKINEGTGTAIADDIGGKNGVLTAGTGSWNATANRNSAARYPNINANAGKSYHFAGDGYISITGSGTDADFQNLVKNYTVIIDGVRCDTPAVGDFGDKYIWAKGYGNSVYGIGHNQGIIRAWIGYGSGVNYYAYGPVIADGSYHQIGYSLDNSTPAKLSVIVDGVKYAAQDLSYDYAPSDATRGVRIAAASDGSRKYTGDIGCITVYTGDLTALQIQQLYENRNKGATEPEATDQMYGRRKGFYNW